FGQKGRPTMAGHRGKGLVMVAAFFLAALLLASVRSGTQAQTGPAPHLFRKSLWEYSTPALLMLAEKYGITQLGTKSLRRDTGPPSSATASRRNDVAIGTAPEDENETTVAANPRDRNHLVAGFHRFLSLRRCVVSVSSDGGATWSPPVLMPSLG